MTCGGYTLSEANIQTDRLKFLKYGKINVCLLLASIERGVFWGSVLWLSQLKIYRKSPTTPGYTHNPFLPLNPLPSRIITARRARQADVNDI